MTDLSKDIDRCMETVEVLRATLPGFDLSLDLMERTLSECKDQLCIPTLTEPVCECRRAG